jgi:hypothetical protein
MLYHARLNVEYTKINIIAFQNEETVLENFAHPILLDNMAEIRLAHYLGTATSSCDCHQDQKLADYIDATTTRYYTLWRAENYFFDVELNSIS